MKCKKVLKITPVLVLIAAMAITPVMMIGSIQIADAYITICADDAPIAASGGNVYVTWHNNKTREVLFRASTDGGQTFGDKINLSNSTNANSAHPDISASGDNVFVSFHDNKSGNVDTYLRTSTDNGQTFGDIVKINGTGTLPQKTKLINLPQLHTMEDTEENTRVAHSGDNVYAVSWDKKSGNWEVFLARSTDVGQTFEETINLSNSPEERSDQAENVAEGDNVYISWWEMSTDNREPVMRVSNDPQ
jgi:hypothetical protein